MFPITKRALSFGEISDYWSRQISPPASSNELLDILLSAWWLGELRVGSGPIRLQLLKNMFTSMRDRDDLGIVFIVGDGAGPLPVELPDGSLEVDLRCQIRVPSNNTESWDEAACKDAFHGLAETSSIESYPEVAVGLTLTQLSYEEFNIWLTKRGYYPKPSFRRSAVKKSKPGRPAEYNWNGVRAQLMDYVSQNGPVQTLGELLEKCGDFASDLHPKKKRPDDNTIREAIRTHALDAAAGVAPGK